MRLLMLFVFLLALLAINAFAQGHPVKCQSCHKVLNPTIVCNPMVTHKRGQTDPKTHEPFLYPTTCVDDNGSEESNMRIGDTRGVRGGGKKRSKEEMQELLELLGRT